jgi:hypothetical protein
MVVKIYIFMSIAYSKEKISLEWKIKKGNKNDLLFLFPLKIFWPVFYFNSFINFSFSKI